MTGKRFFILKDEEFKDVLPCIRDRNSKIDDIYGHYKYDDIEQICLFLNEQNDEIEMLKSKFEDCEFAHRTEMAHHRVIEKDLKKENDELKAQLKQSVFVNLDGEDLSWAINRLCEFHQYPVGTDKERRAMEIILKELGKENPCKDTFYK